MNSFTATPQSALVAPSRRDPLGHLRGAAKLARIPVTVDFSVESPAKPRWIRAPLPAGPEVMRVKQLLRQRGLSSVCEEAACPNLGECFSHGVATFMIMGDICTRRCPFCDVAHGRPQPLDAEEPRQLAEAVAELGLRYVVVTSVDRDDLEDGGASHFAACVQQMRAASPELKIEILTPDFRGRMESALESLAQAPADVFNHNLETVPRLYRAVRPGADYFHSLKLLQQHRRRFPAVPTKSGLMLGLGEEGAEVEEVMRDLRRYGVAMLTLGQYLRPGPGHLPVRRYASPEEFDELGETARRLGFRQVASGPMVRSSYHADVQAQALVGG